MAQRARDAATTTAGGRRGAAGGRGAVAAATAGAPDVAAIRALVTPLVEQAGLDLEGLAVSRAGRRHVVRVIVDGDAGVGHDELGEVSRAISDALDDAERAGGELIPGAYTLEVSSPGISRPLTLPRHWRRNVGRLVKVRIGTRTVTARIASVDPESVWLDEGGRPRQVAFEDLGPGRVQIEFDRVDEADSGADLDAGDETDEEESA